MKSASRSFMAQLQRLGLPGHVETTRAPAAETGAAMGFEQSFRLRIGPADQWAPDLDAAGLNQQSQLDFSGFLAKPRLLNLVKAYSLMSTP